MRKFLLAAPAVVALGVAALVGAGPAFAYGPLGGSAIITAEVTYHPGNIIDLAVSGGPFACGEEVNVGLVNPSGFLGTTPTTCSGGKGSISATFQLPAGYPAGSHDVVAIGATSGDAGSAAFTTTVASAGYYPCATAHVSGAHAVVLASMVLESAANPPRPAMTQRTRRRCFFLVCVQAEIESTATRTPATSAVLPWKPTAGQRSITCDTSAPINADHRRWARRWNVDANVTAIAMPDGIHSHDRLIAKAAVEASRRKYRLAFELTSVTHAASSAGYTTSTTATPVG